MTFKELTESIEINAIEYITRELFKKKDLLKACRAFVKKFKGDSAFLGTIDYTPEELADAVIKDKAELAITLAKRYKPGMGHMAIDSTAEKFNIDKEFIIKKIKELEPSNKELLGEYK